MDFPAVCVDQRLGNGEAKSETSKTAGNLDLSLFECIKDLIDLLAFDTNPGVDDPSFNFVGRRVKGFDNDSAVFGSKFHAVLNQIPKDLLQARGIAFHIRVGGAKPKFYIEILCLDFFSAYLVSALQDLVYGNRFEAQLQLAFRNAGNIEQIVN